MTEEHPFFIVGSGRSGTTLLRVMLAGHPRLTIPAESEFIADLAPGRLARIFGYTPQLERVLAHPRFRAGWQLETEELKAWVASRTPRSYPDLVRAIFDFHAAREGKPRWGDKTPDYVTAIPMLAKMLPNSQFIHIIRDGRDVAASLQEMTWGPHSAVSGAFWWRRKVRAGKQGGGRLPPSRYFEIRFEDLVAEPETQLRALCGFLNEDYAAQMLDYPQRVKTRLTAQGQALPDSHQRLVEPPTIGHRDWTRNLSPVAQRAVEAICYKTLKGCGYDVERPQPLAYAIALLMRIRDAVVDLPRYLRQKLLRFSRRAFVPKPARPAKDKTH